MITVQGKDAEAGYAAVPAGDQAPSASSSSTICRSALQVVLNDGRHLAQPDVEVSVGGDVAEAGDERPRNVRVAREDLVRQLVGGRVGKRLQPPQDGVASELVGQCLRDAAGGPALNQGDALEDVRQRPLLSLLAQSGTASARIFFAAGTSGSTSTTCTGWPSTVANSRWSWSIRPK